MSVRIIWHTTPLELAKERLGRWLAQYWLLEQTLEKEKFEVYKMTSKYIIDDLKADVLRLAKS